MDQSAPPDVAATRIDAEITRLARAVAAYFNALRTSGVPDEVAAILLRDWHARQQLTVDLSESLPDGMHTFEPSPALYATPQRIVLDAPEIVATAARRDPWDTLMLPNPDRRGFLPTPSEAPPEHYQRPGQTRTADTTAVAAARESDRETAADASPRSSLDAGSADIAPLPDRDAAGEATAESPRDAPA